MTRSRMSRSLQAFPSLELSRQLARGAGRRRQLADQIKQASGADRAGLEGRLTVLDNRISRLEGDIDEVGSQLASPAASRVGTTTAPPDFGRNIQFSHVNPVAIVVPFTLFVLSPIALSVSRLIWKRSSRQAPPPMTTDSAQRLERIEQAMDAIAIEVERVSRASGSLRDCCLSVRPPHWRGSGRPKSRCVFHFATPTPRADAVVRFARQR